MEWINPCGGPHTVDDGEGAVQGSKRPAVLIQDKSISRQLPCLYRNPLVSMEESQYAETGES
jgi:hypothetical protein